MCSTCSTNRFDIERLRIGDVVAKVFEAVEGPHDLLGLGFEFNQQRLSFTSVAVADDVVAVRQNFQRRDPRQRDAGEVALFDLPDDLLVARDLNDAVSVPVAMSVLPFGILTAAKHLLPNASMP